jgi:anti-sigma-K factor RskA
MRPLAGEQERYWEVLELIGSYAAGELEGDDSREAEQLIFERAEYRRVAESYARMLVMLSTLGNEPVEAPEAIVSYALRRAYLFAFLRQAEQVMRGLVGDYVAALTFYLGLRPARQQ